MDLSLEQLMVSQSEHGTLGNTVKEILSVCSQLHYPLLDLKISFEFQLK
jgi:hypothetical protein